MELGELPIFIRSDTNMEDLQEFTGAGLNLTTFNIRDREEILQSIRLVWASPFTERSFMWRQKYLLNPENVYPSLLLLPSVNVEKSGVVITTAIFSSNPDNIVVAMNWGGGGAVEVLPAEDEYGSYVQQLALAVARINSDSEGYDLLAQMLVTRLKASGDSEEAQAA